MTREITTTCCIAGGGPAGMMLGFLLARAGIDVIVLEKHADFLRDFRGDTIHPSTLELMRELGFLEAFLQQPHQKAYQLRARFEGVETIIADFSQLPLACPFIAFMPQWDFLNFLVSRGRKYENFHLMTETEATGLIKENGRVSGIEASSPEGLMKIHALLSVGADGRHSVLRGKAGLEVIESGVPIDVLWMKLSHRDGDPEQPVGNFGKGRAFVMIYRGAYWQCAYIIAKGHYDEIQAEGLPAFRESIISVAPFIADRLQELASWDDIKLLSVSVNHLKEWSRAGLLCIGDAAHAMSPIGGVGINLAVQDAVATANILTDPLLSGCLTEGDLRKVQRRRAFPARMIQFMQIFMHKRIFSSNSMREPRKNQPLLVKMIQKIPFLRQLPARIIGMGFKPEHICTKEGGSR